MATYTTEIGADNIAFLTDTGSSLGCAGVLDHVAGADQQPNPDTMVFDETAASILQGLPGDYDGHFDGDNIWIGGTPYPVEVTVRRTSTYQPTDAFLAAMDYLRSGGQFVPSCSVCGGAGHEGGCY